MASALDYLRQLLGGGDPEAEQNAQASTAMQPSVLQHLKDAIGDVPGRLSGQSYDPSQSFAQNALNPQGIDQATTLAMMAGPGAIRAWHASPHNFDQFDMSKIGSGQGAQTYGHGIYAAESPAVSGRGGQYDLEFTAKNLGKPDLNQGEASVLRTLRGGGSDLDVISDLARSGYSFEEATKTLESVKNARAKIYEVDLHADPEAFLNWDKPLGAQSQSVQEALNRGGAYQGPSMSLGGDPAGAVLKRALASPYHAADLFNRGGEPLQLTPADISQRLNQAGIPGVRYLDQGSRGAGTGTSNYVIFDPKIIEIMRKYGIVPPLAGAGLLAEQP